MYIERLGASALTQVDEVVGINSLVRRSVVSMVVFVVSNGGVVS